MFSFPLAQEFKQRAQAAIPFPRAAIAAFASRQFSRVPPLGAFGSLGAIGLGAALMIANVAHERRVAAETVAVAPPAIVAPVQAVALAPPKLEPKPDPIAAAATVAPTPEKTTERIDTTPTGSIADTPKPKAKHKHHPKKAVDANP